MRVRTRSAGFTLLEVLAVVMLTAVVIGIALDFYVDLSRDTLRATAFTRDIRRATAILDRVARDFERTVLLAKASDEDPLAHPWLFLGESRGSALGSDHLKFTTLNQTPRGSAIHESDFAMVAYLTRDDLDSEGLELLRWSWPRLPESLDREFPLPEDEGVLLLAEGLADFGVRFLGADGEWREVWDSSQLVESGELPLAVEIELALLPAEDGPLPEELVTYSRMVNLPLRPIARSALTGEPPVGGPDEQARSREMGEAIAESLGEEATPQDLIRLMLQAGGGGGQ